MRDPCRRTGSTPAADRANSWAGPPVAICVINLPARPAAARRPSNVASDRSRRRHGGRSADGRPSRNRIAWPLLRSQPTRWRHECPGTLDCSPACPRASRHESPHNRKDTSRAASVFDHSTVGISSGRARLHDARHPESGGGARRKPASRWSCWTCPASRTSRTSCATM